MDVRAARRHGGTTAHACPSEADRTLFEGVRASGGKRAELACTRCRQHRLRPARRAGPTLMAPGFSTLLEKGGAGGDVLPG
jgi:hypothetical protein